MHPPIVIGVVSQLQLVELGTSFVQPLKHLVIAQSLGMIHRQRCILYLLSDQKLESVAHFIYDLLGFLVALC